LIFAAVFYFLRRRARSRAAWAAVPWHSIHVDLISDALPFGRLWYEPNAISNAFGYAKFRSRSHDAVIRAYDTTGNAIETHEHAGEFKEP